MEINNFSQSASSIYLQMAHNRAEQSNIDKKEFEKSTQESYDQLNSTSTKYDGKSQELISSALNNADAQLTRSANLNKLLLQSQDLIQGVSHEN